MPIVFVHGVAVRDEPGQDQYDNRVKRRDGLICQYLMSDDPLQPYQGLLLNPYWGKYGAKFAFDMQCLPEAGRGVTLGPTLQVEDLAIGGFQDPEFLLTRVAQQSLLEAIDLVLFLTMETLADQNDPEFSRLAFAWAEWVCSLPGDPPRADWATDQMTNDAFLAELQRRVQSWAGLHPGGVTLGAGWSRALGKISAGAGRLVGDLRNLVSRSALRVARDSLQDKVAVFIGDVFIFLKERGEAASPGAIVREIVDAIETAADHSSHNDPLILIGHSLGGVILYDILTHFITARRPGWKADALVTVGSQIGLFEEMRLFHASATDTGRHGDRVVKAAAPSAKTWINIYDEVDVLSFRAEPIFENVQDFRFSSRTGVMSAHSAYFQRPTLFRRIRRRMIDTGTPLP